MDNANVAKNDTGRFVAHYALWKLLLAEAGALGFVVLGVFLFRANPAVAILSVGFFGLCGLAGFPRIFDHQDVLIIDKNGFLDRRIFDRPILWDAVSSIRIWKYKRHTYLLLSFNEPLKNFHSVSWFKRFTVRVNKYYTGADACLTANSLNTSFSELKSALDKLAPARLTNALDAG